jgi:FtsZ-binding cell division protein ZapB
MTINQAVMNFIEKFDIKQVDLFKLLEMKTKQNLNYTLKTARRPIKMTELKTWAYALSKLSGQTPQYVENYILNMVSTDSNDSVKYSLPNHTSQVEDVLIEYDSHNIHLLQVKIQELSIIKDALLKELRAKEKMIKDLEKDKEELRRDKEQLRMLLSKYETK